MIFANEFFYMAVSKGRRFGERFFVFMRIGISVVI